MRRKLESWIIFCRDKDKFRCNNHRVRWLFNKHLIKNKLLLSLLVNYLLWSLFDSLWWTISIYGFIWSPRYRYIQYILAPCKSPFPALHTSKQRYKWNWNYKKYWINILITKSYQDNLDIDCLSKISDLLSACIKFQLVISRMLWDNSKC